MSEPSEHGNGWEKNLLEVEKDLLKVEKDLLDLTGPPTPTPGAPGVGLRAAAGYPPPYWGVYPAAMPIDYFGAAGLFGPGGIARKSCDMTVRKAPLCGRCICGSETPHMHQDRCYNCADKCVNRACGRKVYCTRDVYGDVALKCAECRLKNRNN